MGSERMSYIQDDHSVNETMVQCGALDYPLFENVS